METSINIHRDLIERCRHADRRAQKELHGHYIRAMLNTAYRLVRNEEDARDICQEAFLKAFQNLSQYRGQSTFGSWLKRIVINTALNHLKKKEIPVIENGEGALEGYSDNRSVERDYEGISVDEARMALLELPTGYRTVVSLYLLEGYDHKEIAEILGVSVNTSLSQYNRGKKKLKEILAKKYHHGRA